MKTTTILLLFASSLVYGQQPAQSQEPVFLPPPQAPQPPDPPPQAQEASPRREGLRVALDIKSVNADSRTYKIMDHVRTVLTTELRKLGDVRVTNPSEPSDETLQVLVAGGICTTVIVMHTRPSPDGQILVSATVLGSTAKDQWVGFVHDFDHQVLEDDRRRLFR